MKYYLSAIVLLVIIIGGGWWLMTRNTTPTIPSDQTATTSESSFNTNATTTATSTTVAPTGITMTEVKKHNKATDCYTAINGNVYNVTSWIDQHPGGADAIISLCGIDGSSAFDSQHGGQRRPESELASFKIGALAK
jgi:cytochrome b involved in lipid metabolism